MARLLSAHAAVTSVWSGKITLHFKRNRAAQARPFMHERPFVFLVFSLPAKALGHSRSFARATTEAMICHLFATCVLHQRYALDVDDRLTDAGRPQTRNNDLRNPPRQGVAITSSRAASCQALRDPSKDTPMWIQISHGGGGRSLQSDPERHRNRHLRSNRRMQEWIGSDLPAMAAIPCHAAWGDCMPPMKRLTSQSALNADHDAKLRSTGGRKISLKSQ